MSFTLFVLLPNQDVCSLRRLASRSSIWAVRKTLELSGGLPAHTYDLAFPDGKLLADDTLLQLDKNVWDGYILRATFRDDWLELFDAVVMNDIGHVLEYCSLHELNGGKVKDVRKGRGVVALFMASSVGLVDLCSALLCAGVDPDAKTPFGRTPLFAAMSNDHAHVTELLLSHNATLESRDRDGTSAADVAREHQAKECLRKVRQLRLFSRVSSATSSTASGTSVREPDHQKFQQQVIRIPTGISAEAEASDSLSNEKILMAGGDDSSSPPKTDSSPGPQNSSFTNGIAKTLSTPTASSRPSPRSLFRTTEVYTWENNLRSVSRASSAAGTQVRIPVPGVEGISSGRSSRASNGHRVSWSDTMSVGSGVGTTRRPSLKPSVRDLSITGPQSVLKVSCSLSPTHTSDSKLSNTETDQTEDQAPTPLPDAYQANEPQTPTEEPSQRLPSRPDNQQASREEGTPVLAGSIRIHVPEQAKGDCDTSRESEPESPRHKAALGKETAGDGVMLSKGSRASPTSPHLVRSRRKQHASWRTMKRRLKLAEDRKRTTSPKSNTKPNRHKEAGTASFEQWLQRKRREKERQQDSSEAESSSDGEDEEARSAENERAFNDWLKDLKERPLRGPHPFTPASLHRRKSRPLKNLIQIGSNREESVPTPDPDSYMTAYQEWRRGKTYTTDTDEAPVSPRDLKEAKRKVEEKRKSLLAEALTYEDWLDHTEQRQQLMQATLRADSNKFTSVDEILLTRRAPNQISFSQWRQRLRKREAELRDQEKQRMRKPGEPYHDKHGFLITDDNIRSSAAIPHEEWLKQKTDEKNRNSKKTMSKNGIAKKQEESKMRRKIQGSSPKGRSKQESSMLVSEDGKESAWEMWLQRKHQSEVEQLSRELCTGKQLLQNVHQKKTPRVTQY